jgi:dihydroorotate dehydrogenase (NAD+) catalytic subunit
MRLHRGAGVQYKTTEMADLKIKIKGLEFKNPVITASGTFGYGPEFEDFFNISHLGGIIVKGTTLEAREGNAYPRMAETASGMLNAVGLQNKGIDHFIKKIYPEIKKYNTNIIVNVSGSKIEDYVAVVEKLNDLEKIPAIELNISCPNVKQGGMAFGTSCESAAEVTKAIRKACKKILIVKLSPNVTDIASIAKAVEAEGADAVSLINTLLGMAIHAETRKPVLSTVTGGLSGPAIKPVALRMVWQVAKAVKIPVIGLGGIMRASDAIEFLLAGATAVQIGTANFIDPQISIKIVQGIEDYVVRHKMNSVKELTGALEV